MRSREDNAIFTSVPIEDIEFYKQANDELEKENKQLKDKYLNAVADYENEKSKNSRAIEYMHNFDVFDKFSFPLMKKWEEQQVKSSIEYEFNQTLYKDLLEILKGE